MTPDKIQEEVKPCPFCGKERDSQKLNEEPVVWAVLCDDCNIGVSDGETEQEAVQKWNHRPRELALLEGLKLAKEALEIFRNANGMSDCSNEHLHNMATSSASVRSPAKAEQFYRSAITNIEALLSTEAQQTK